MAEINTVTHTPAEIRASGDEANFPTLIATVSASSAALAAGTVLGLITASGLAVAYDNSAIDGSEVAVGILAQDVDPVGEGREKPVPMYVGGLFVESKLTGLDANAKSDLAGASIANGVFKF